MHRKNLSIVVAGGGTGGHLFPGIAIAKQLLKDNPLNIISFAGTDKEFEKIILKKQGFTHKVINISGLKGSGIINKIKVLFKLPVSIFSAMIFLWRNQVDLVIGTGGYSSGPVIIAAWILRKKRVIQEQNIIPGITNKIASKFSNYVFTAFEESKHFFPVGKTIVTGNPVRDEIIKASLEIRGKNKSENITIVITGGSQGAENLNKKSVDAVRLLRNKDKLRIFHQTGIKDEELISRKYEKLGINAVVKDFFTDMAGLYCKSDLIISRAGATTISEITSLGLASILVPYPFAADNHQELNARMLEKEGASVVMTENFLTAGKLAERIDFLTGHPEKLKEMREKSKKLGKTDAAEKITEYCNKLFE